MYANQSNHKEIKCLPIFVRNSSKYHGIIVKLIDVSSIPGESSAILSEFVMTLVQKYNLKTKLLRSVLTTQIRILVVLKEKVIITFLSN